MNRQWNEPWRRWRYVRWYDILRIMNPIFFILHFDSLLRKRWEREIPEAVISHGIVVVTDYPDGTMSVLHFEGYNSKPVIQDYESLDKKIRSDPEIGLIGRGDWRLMLATPEMVAHYTDKRWFV